MTVTTLKTPLTIATVLSEMAFGAVDKFGPEALMKGPTGVQTLIDTMAATLVAKSGCSDDEAQNVSRAAILSALSARLAFGIETAKIVRNR